MDRKKTIPTKQGFVPFLYYLSSIDFHRTLLYKLMFVPITPPTSSAKYFFRSWEGSSIFFIWFSATSWSHIGQVAFSVAAKEETYLRNAVNKAGN
jgi:hypothetical protein